MANIIGWQRTRELLLFAVTIKADAAAKWGLVDEVWPSREETFSKVSRKAHILAKNAPAAMKAQKHLLQYWEENDLKSGIATSIDVFAAAFENGAAEPKERIATFLNARAVYNSGRERVTPTSTEPSDQNPVTTSLSNKRRAC